MTYKPEGVWERITRKPVPEEDPLSVFGQNAFEQPDPRRVQPPAELGIDVTSLNDSQMQTWHIAQQRLVAAQEVPGLGVGETVLGLLCGGLKPERRAALQQRHADMELYGTIANDLAMGVDPNTGRPY